MLKRNKFLIIFLALLITFTGVAVAADVDNSTDVTIDSTSTVVSDSTPAVDTQVTSSVNEDNNLVKETKNVKRDENDPIIVSSSSEFDALFDTVSTGTIQVNQIKNSYSGKTIKINTDITRNDNSYIINVPITLTSDYNNTIDLNTSNGYDSSIIEHWTSLNFTTGASGSIITNMQFHNTQIFVLDADYITFDHTTVTANQPCGRGTGIFALREGSTHISVTNNYFNINDNGGISVIALTNAEDCLIDHNVITGSGSVGNLIYLNTYFYNTNPAPTVTNRHNTISYNTLTGPTTPVNTCFAIAIAGPDNTIEHNNIYYGGTGITTNWQGSYDEEIIELEDDDFETVYEGNKYYYNNLYNGATFLCGNYSVVENNYITGTSNFAGHSNVTSNTLLDAITVKNNVRFHSNTATGQTVTVQKANSCFKDNTIGTLKITGAYTTYDCGGNTISNYHGSSEDYFITCNGNCPNCISTINNRQGNNKNLKSDDGPTIIDVEGGKEYTYTYIDNISRTHIFTFVVYNNGTLFLNANTSMWTFLAGSPFPLVNFNDFDVTITDFVINLTERNPNNVKTHIHATFENPCDYENINLIVRSDGIKNTDLGFEQSSSPELFDYKTVTFENMRVITTNYDKLENSYCNIAKNLILKNSVIKIIQSTEDDFPSGPNDKIAVFENATLENCEIEVVLNKSWYSRKGIYRENNGVNISSNAVLRNNTITVHSYDKDSSIPEDDYGHTIVLSGDNITFIDNTVNSRYVRGISIVGSNNIVENNTITKSGTYTINITGENNIVRYNTLYAEAYEGDDSVIDTGINNIVENNLPEKLVPTLKVDTTEFTSGTQANIKASIYLGDEIMSDINKGKVTFKVNGKTLKDASGKVIYAKVIGGVASIEGYEIPQGWKEGSTIQAVYSGSSDLAKMSSEKTNITITSTEPTIQTENITANEGSTINLTASITSVTPINTGKVVFKINGKTVKDASGKVIYAKVVNNQVNIEYTLPEDMTAGTYNITAVFISVDYGKLEDSKALTVTN